MSKPRFARIVVWTPTSASPAEAWALLTDWPAQSRWIPFTKVTADGPSNGAGTRFTGRTRIGPIHFDDPMEVTHWQPPGDDGLGSCTVRKLGPWILGTARIEVMPGAGGSAATIVTWRESVRVRWVPAVFNPLVRAGGGILFRVALRRAVRELDSG